LTGGIASGKSTVSRILSDLGATVIDADEVSREVVATGGDAWKEIVESFGAGILNEDGSIDRHKLGAIVFRDRSALERLNRIVHPRVIAVIESRLKELRRRPDPPPAAVVDAPLLIEAGMTRMVDVVWVVGVDRHTQVERLMCRDRFTLEEAERRIAAQMPLAEKIRFADAVIDNSGPLEATERQVRDLWFSLIERQTE